MEATKSFKQMIQAGEVKRADAMKVQLEDIHEEPGFNGRLNTDSAEFLDGIRQFAEHIAAGGTYPPLEVRPRPAGGVFVVEGHRRRLALRMARDELGAPIDWVKVEAFTGNDADRVARIATSASQVPLTPLEQALVYKRLAGFGLSSAEIGTKVSKTPQHVDQLLTLANANTDVQQMVAAGGVSAAVAVGVVRKHGENAGQVLRQEKAKAAAAGKGKVTAGTMKQWTPPAKVMEPLVLSVDGLLESLGPQDHEFISKLRSGSGSDGKVFVSASAVLSLLDQHTALVEARKKAEAKARDKAAKAKQQQLKEGAAS